MAHRSDEKQSQRSKENPNDLTDDLKHLPDVIVDGEPSEAFDLPRQGTPKDVSDVSKASARLPEFLVDE